MTPNALNLLRFWFPALGAVFLYSILAICTGFTEIKIPHDMKDWALTPPLAFVAVVFYLTPLRRWESQYFYRNINENIRARLVEISDLNDDKDRFTWKNLKPIFYEIIDNDKSLSGKSQVIMFNGFLWSSAADMVVLSILFSIIALLLNILGFEGAVRAFTAYTGISVLALFLQISLTGKHMQLGNDQLDHMEQLHRDKIRSKIKSIKS